MNSETKGLKEFYPAIHPVENALSIALLNAGGEMHSVLMLLNTGPIESLPSWHIDKEGASESVIKLLVECDKERIALRKALGFSSHHYPFSDHYYEDSQNEWMYGRKAHSDLGESDRWREHLEFKNHRYIVEDVRYNLALHSSIGDFCNVETPITDSLLKLIGVIVDEDFEKTGRTLEYLDLADKPLDEIMNILFEGF